MSASFSLRVMRVEDHPRLLALMQARLAALARKGIAKSHCACW